MHNSLKTSNAQPISEKSAYVGRLLRSRREWSSLQDGERKHSWSFDAQLRRNSNAQRFRRNRLTWVDFSEVDRSGRGYRTVTGSTRGPLMHNYDATSNAQPISEKSAYVNYRDGMGHQFCVESAGYWFAKRRGRPPGRGLTIAVQAVCLSVSNCRRLVIRRSYARLAGKRCAIDQRTGNFDTGLSVRQKPVRRANHSRRGQLQYSSP